MWFLTVASLLVVCLVSFGAGYWVGWRQAEERVRDEFDRILPPTRTPGQPTNADAEPARVTISKYRNPRRYAP